MTKLLLTFLSLVILFASFAQRRQCSRCKDSCLATVITQTQQCKLDSVYLTTDSLNSETKEFLVEAKNYLQRQNKSENLFGSVLDSTEKIVGILSAILALVTGILAFTKKSWVDKWKGILTTASFFFFSIFLAYLFKDLILIAVIAFLVIVISIYLLLHIFLKYLIVLDEKGYGTIDKLAKLLEIKKNYSSNSSSNDNDEDSSNTHGLKL